MCARMTKGQRRLRLDLEFKVWISDLLGIFDKNAILDKLLLSITVFKEAQSPRIISQKCTWARQT